MSEHTPAPWKWCGNDIEAEDYTQGDVMSPTVNCGPFCYGGMVELGITEANARHIVYCVNNHERLVEGYRALRDQCDMNLDDIPSSVREELIAADELLAALEAEKGGEL